MLEQAWYLIGNALESWAVLVRTVHCGALRGLGAALRGRVKVQAEM